MIAADVTKEEECKRFIDETVNLYGCLDHLVNNAVIAGSFLFEEANTTAFSTCYGCHILGERLPDILCTSPFEAILW